MLLCASAGPPMNSSKTSYEHGLLLDSVRLHTNRHKLGRSFLSFRYPPILGGQYNFGRGACGDFIWRTSSRFLIYSRSEESCLWSKSRGTSVFSMASVPAPYPAATLRPSGLQRRAPLSLNIQTVRIQRWCGENRGPKARPN